MDDATRTFWDNQFQRNVKDARDNGYDFLCAVCGAGITDDSDMHDLWCPHHPTPFAAYAAFTAAIAEELNL